MPWKPDLANKRTPKPKTDRSNYNQTHRDLRRVVLSKHPLCQVKEEGCKGWATQAHHIRYPARTIEDYAAVCESCHKWIHKS